MDRATRERDFIILHFPMKKLQNAVIYCHKLFRMRGHHGKWQIQAARATMLPPAS